MIRFASPRRLLNVLSFFFECEDCLNALFRCGKIEEDEVTLVRLRWNAPQNGSRVVLQLFFKMLAFDGHDPDVEPQAKLPPKFNDVQVLWWVRPIVFPTDEPVTF